VELGSMQGMLRGCLPTSCSASLWKA